ATLARYEVQTGPDSPAAGAASELFPYIREWSEPYLLGVMYSGSYAKGTGVRGGHDLDLFISLDHDAPGTLKELYWSLFNYLSNKGWSPTPQNVSLGVTCRGMHVDLVPGKKQAGNPNDHSLYKRKADTWVQTNVDQHVKLIRNSGRVT